MGRHITVIDLIDKLSMIAQDRKQGFMLPIKVTLGNDRDYDVVEALLDGNEVCIVCFKPRAYGEVGV